MASEPSSGAAGSFADTPSVGLRTRDNDHVEGFLNFGAGFTDATSLRFLDAREEVPVPKRLSPIPFTDSVISPNSVREGLAGATAESSSGSSPRWGGLAPLSLDSSLPSERCPLDFDAEEVDLSSSGGDFFSDLSSSVGDSFPVLLDTGLSSSTSGSDPLWRGSVVFGQRCRYFNPIF